jgi:rSAM/selenodomain-associated transferase 2
MNLSIVIPTLNEEAALPALLHDLRALSSASTEIIVADGGSSDATVAVAAAAGARVVTARRGRARQMNRGARAALREWLLFLHADSRLDQSAALVLRSALEEPPSFDTAVFRFAIDLPRMWKYVIETGQALRESVLGLPYGDQGLLVRRDAFVAVGGFPDIPLMEDVTLVRTLRQHGGVARLPAALLTSGRRYEQGGVLRTWGRHTLLIALHAAGVSPSRLAHWHNGSNALPR